MKHTLIRWLLPAAAAGALIAAAAVPAATASPASAHAVTAPARTAAALAAAGKAIPLTSCRSVVVWTSDGYLNTYYLDPFGGLNGDPMVDLYGTTEYCQYSTGFTYDGFPWYAYQLSGTDECLTTNSSASEQTYEDTCGGQASQQWAATDLQTGGCGGYNCWLIGNAYYTERGYALALVDGGYDNSPAEITFPSGGTPASDPYQFWAVETAS